jgi:hypothetical protein
MKKNKKQNDKKPILKSTLITEDALYEMVYNRTLNTTSFVKAGRNGTNDYFLNEVEIDGEIYKPLPVWNALVEKKMILFPTLPLPYENEEQLLKEIQAYIHKYLDVSEAFEPIATYYILFTWLYDRFNEVPYLRALGDFGTGKSRFKDVIGSVCYKPVFTSGATTLSPLFRIIDDVKGTLIIDEADFKHSDKDSDIIKLLNVGYQKGGAIFRSEGKGVFEVKGFDVFCPKIVATRETFADRALESRFLVEEMGVDKLRPGIPLSLKKEFYDDAEELRNKLLMWRMNNYFTPITYREDAIEGIHPRLNQIVIPLLSIIKDEQICKNLIAFIIKYNNELVEDRNLTIESVVIFAILKLKHDNFDEREFTTKEISEEVNKLLEDKEDSITPRKTGWYLRKRLQLKIRRNQRGFVLSFKANKEKLDMWKGRYGITDALIRGEEVNDVNDVNVVEGVKKSDLLQG